MYGMLGNNPIKKMDKLGLKQICCVKSLTVKYVGNYESETEAHHIFEVDAIYEKLNVQKGKDCCNPLLCDFRQEVRGYYNKDGKNISLNSSGSMIPITKDIFIDDGYSYLNDDDTNNDHIYKVTDLPGIDQLPSNSDVDYFLEFNAKVIDSAFNDFAIRAEKKGYWIRIQGTYKRNFSHGGF